MISTIQRSTLPNEDHVVSMQHVSSTEDATQSSRFFAAWGQWRPYILGCLTLLILLCVTAMTNTPNTTARRRLPGGQHGSADQTNVTVDHNSGCDDCSQVTQLSVILFCTVSALILLLAGIPLTWWEFSDGDSPGSMVVKIFAIVLAVFMALFVIFVFAKGFQCCCGKSVVKIASVSKGVLGSAAFGFKASTILLIASILDKPNNPGQNQPAAAVEADGRLLFDYGHYYNGMYKKDGYFYVEKSKQELNNLDCEEVLTEITVNDVSKEKQNELEAELAELEGVDINYSDDTHSMTLTGNDLALKEAKTKLEKFPELKFDYEVEDGWLRSTKLIADMTRTITIKQTAVDSLTQERMDLLNAEKDGDRGFIYDSNTNTIEITGDYQEAKAFMNEELELDEYSDWNYENSLYDIYDLEDANEFNLVGFAVAATVLFFMVFVVFLIFCCYRKCTSDN